MYWENNMIWINSDKRKAWYVMQQIISIIYIMIYTFWRDHDLI